MKTILYAYLNNNLGDDLFIHMITNRYSKVMFKMWVEKDKLSLFHDISNLKLIDRDSGIINGLGRLRPSLAARYRDVVEKKCDAVVYIGGSIFIEYGNWAIVSAWWEYEAEHRNFYVLGANFGPYYSEKYRRKMKEIFGKMRDVCFRDQYSYNLFSDVNTVRCAPDILLGYPMPQVSTNKKLIFVSAIDCLSKDEGRNRLREYDTYYVSQMASLLKIYYQQGYLISFASFCEAEGDEIGINKIIEKMNCNAEDSAINILRYNGNNAEKILESMSESEFIIATRFHASILGFAAEKPVLPIIYSDKTKHILEDLKFQGVILDLRNDDFVQWECENIELEKQKIKNMDYYIKESEKHFLRLDKLLL